MSAEMEKLAARPRLLANPEWCPGAYSLHLYCKYENTDHGWNEFPHEYDEAQTYGQAAAIARGSGWILHRDRTATCPKCAAALRAHPTTTGESGL